MKKTDPEDKKKNSLVGKRVILDGKPIGSDGGGGYYESVSGEDVPPPKMKVKYPGKASNPGATAKAIMASGSNKVRMKKNTNYKSTGSKKGVATPEKKRKSM